MDLIRFDCPHCGAAIDVPEHAAGQSGTCDTCGEPFLHAEAADVVSLLLDTALASNGGATGAGAISLFRESTGQGIVNRNRLKGTR